MLQSMGSQRVDTTERLKNSNDLSTFSCVAGSPLQEQQLFFCQ